MSAVSLIRAEIIFQNHQFSSSSTEGHTMYNIKLIIHIPGSEVINNKIIQQQILKGKWLVSKACDQNKRMN